ncbi:MAG: IS66 family transposase, partial [Lachnospiraceae bacterium]|nr:IS66 family transposase [Candidatus Darwinimomas equi]
MATIYTREELNSMSKETLIEIILSMRDQLEDLNKNFTVLTEQLKVLTQHRFGRSTEKLQTEGQLSLAEIGGEIAIVFNEIEAVLDEDAEDEAEKSTARAPKRHKGQREESLIGLPTEIIPHEFSEAELSEKFGGKYKRLPDEIYKRIVFEPAKISVEEHHVAVYSGSDDKIVRANRPKDLLRCSLVTPSLEAGILNGKYVNGMPLYRLEQEFSRHGLSVVNRQNMSNWTNQCCEKYLGILYDHLHKKLYDYHVLHADETPVEITKDGRPAGSKSYMWVYRTGRMYDKPIVIYDYQRTRKADHPREFLKDFTGVCVTDGYQVYHTLAKERTDIRIAGCWYHARRRYSEALKALPKKEQNKSLAHKALLLIQAIDRANQSLDDLSPEERLSKRQSMVKPLVDAYFAWIHENRGKVLNKSKTSNGFEYSLNQEEYLRTFLDDPYVPFDNNAAEQAIRPFCIGKKNWVLIDTIRGAQNSAI